MMIQKTPQQIFDEKEKTVLKHLRKILDDIRESIVVLSNAKPELIKSRLCLAFIATDTFSRFYAVLIGDKELESKNQKRFRFWVDNFVFTEKNSEYCENRKELKFNSLELWELRNSMVHFYGLPRDGEVILGGGISEDSKTFKIIKEAIRRSDKNYKIINPFSLMKALMEGLLVQLQQMVEMIKTEPKTYIEGINNCYDIFQREGTQFVRPDEFDS